MKNLASKYQRFIQERNWEKFHKPKNVAMALSVEASELVELFQWKDNLDSEELKKDDELKHKVQEELADILLYSFSMANEFDIDIEEAVEQKLEKNKERFDEDTASKIEEELNRWTRD